jgi:hypothetical protein
MTSHAMPSHRSGTAPDRRATLLMDVLREIVGELNGHALQRKARFFA